MNILMASMFEGVIPPDRYGGVERLVYWQIKELQKRGHTVTLVGREGSDAGCDLIPYNQDNKKQVISESIRTLGPKYDIVHEHGQSYSAGDVPNYIWTNSDSGEHLFNKFKNKVHHNQAQAIAEGLPEWAYVHIGMPVDDTLYFDSKQDYLVYISCVSHRHGADLAIEIAKRSRTKLIFVNDLDLNREGYREFVQPNLGEYVEFFDLSQFPSSTGDVKKKIMVANAKGLLAPTRDTTFGIVLIEAMVSGTPCIVTASEDPMHMPAGEVIINGETGFVCKDIDECVEAVSHLHTIKSSNCKNHVNNEYTVEKMMDRYIELYDRVHKGETW